MIKGQNGVAGYGTTLDAVGRRVEHEYRQCSHCQFTWVFKPGSGRKFGFCLYCNGLMCGACTKRKWQKTDNRCIPFYEGALLDDKRYILDTELGIYIRK